MPLPPSSTATTTTATTATTTTQPPTKPPRTTPHIPTLLIATDASQAVSYVSESFEQFTGFSQSEVLGKRCNFLQGEETSTEDLAELRVAIQQKKNTSVVVLNYTKSHTPFWNILSIRPSFSTAGVVSGYMGEIISLPVLRHDGRFVKLCLDDALAILRVASMIPKTIALPQSPKIAMLEDDEETDDTDRRSITPSSSPNTTERPITPPEVRLQRHQNYLALLQDYTTQQEQQPHHFKFVAETLLPTHRGRFRVRAYRCDETGAEPLAMIVGDVEGRDGVLCRVHDQCQTSEVFGSLRCDCKEQLDHALDRIQAEEGIVFYLPQEGRGIGLANKVAAYAAQEMGLDTVDANRSLGLPDDARRYDAVRDICKDLNLGSLRLMTNNPRKVDQLTKLGVSVRERVPIVVQPNSVFAATYVRSKVERMQHIVG